MMKIYNGPLHIFLLSVAILFLSSTTSYAGQQAGWKIVSAGGSHTAAVKTDGTLWAWGNNYYGQLGDGTMENKSTPVQIESDNKWKMVSAGGAHTVAIKTDGTLWAWGYNEVGCQ